MLSTLTNRWENLFSNPFEAVRREFDSHWGWETNGNGPHRMPSYGSLSLSEDSEHFYIEMDVPGMQIDDIELTLEKGHLCIRGERKAVSSDRARLHEERIYGQFQRMIALSNTVDPSAVEATLREGVLYVTLTKRRECQPHRIEVKPGDVGQARIAAS